MIDINIEPYKKEYLEYFKVWLLNNHLMELMDMGPFAQSDIEGWLDNPDQVTLMVRNEKDEIIGFSNFHHFSENKKIAKIGLLIDPSFQGKGYGKITLKKSIEYGFKILRLDKIEASVKQENIVSKNNTESAGFKFDFYDKDKGKYYYSLTKIQYL